VEREPGVPGFSTPDLEQLMIGYQQGDAAAAKSLVDLLGRRLYVFFASQMGDRADADDMTQEAWLRIHRVRHTYRPGEPVLPWVYAIARRVRIDGYRRRRRVEARERAGASLPEVRETRDAPGELPSFAELVAPLPESQREALTMLKVDGLSIEEVARATSSTEGAVKQKVHRAYTRLRALLQQPVSGRAEGGKIR
jgi:RNA polymerase sigma-70 factor (ECF subfamily)